MEWKDYSLTERGAGQWDELHGSLVGLWDDPLAARNALTGRKITLPGMANGYGFFISGGDLTTGWGANGKVRAEFSAPGLFGEKFKLTKNTAADNFSLTNITVGTGVPGLPAGLYQKLNARIVRRVYDVQAAWVVSAGAEAYDMANVGETITAHWAAAKAGLTLGSTAPGSEPNPFAGNADAECTFHYPRNWSYELIPGDRLGPPIGGLALATYRFTWQWPKTL